MFQSIPIDQVHPATDNIRRRLGDTRDLAASIASVGVIEPLLVTPRPEEDGGGYTVVAGHRRLAAGKTAGLTELPCTVRALSDLERVEIMMVENLARCDLSVIEEAAGYFRMAEFGLNARDLAKRLGRSASHIRARLALLELPKSTQAKVDNGAITISEATALLALKEHPEVIARLLDAGQHPYAHQDLERAVVREVARIEVEARIAAAKADLDDQGVRLIERRDRFSTTAGQPVAIGRRPGELDVRLNRHESEPCHAANVTRTGEVVPLCCDPGRHETDGDSKIKAPRDAEPPSAEPPRPDRSAADRAAAMKRHEHERQRRAFSVELLGRRLPRADVQALVAAQWIAYVDADLARSGCELLGLDVVDDGFGESYTDAIAALADESTTSRDRACLALALAVGDDAAARLSTGPAATTHLAFLASYGWQESEPTAAPAEAAADQATAA